MDFTCDTRDLARAIEIAGRIADKKGAMPILGGALVVATGEGVTVQATDLDLSVSAEITARVAAPGRVLCDVRRLGDVVRAAFEETIRISAEKRGAAVVESGRWRCEIAGMPAGDFPRIAAVPEASWEAAPDGLPLGLARVWPAISTDPTRFHLCSASLVREGGTATLVATDGHRIHVARLPWPGADRPEVMLPRRAIAAFRALIDGGDAVEVSFSRDLLGVRAGGVTIAAKPGEGAFPPWRKVLPDPDPRRGATVLRDDLDRMIGRARATRARIVDLSDGDGAIACRAEDPAAILATDAIPCEGKIGGRALFAPDLLRDWILNATADRIRLSPVGGGADVLVLSEEGAGAVPGAYVGGVMPCRP